MSWLRNGLSLVYHLYVNHMSHVRFLVNMTSRVKEDLHIIKLARVSTIKF